MKAGIAHNGRTFLAALTAALLVASMVFLLADPAARASHEPPDDTYTSSAGDGSNEADFWETRFGLAEGSCTKLNLSGEAAFVMPDPPSGEEWFALVVKQGSGDPDNFIYLNPVAGHSYPSTGSNAPGYSHLIVCSVPETTTTTTAPPTTTTVPPTTTTVPPTTTTVPPTTTTTVPATTTTVPATTTTTVESTTTTVESTTTTIGSSVGAAILVTVTGVCVEDGEDGVGRITVTMSVAGGADVVIRDSDGDVVGSLSADGTITVPEGAVYTWVATPNEGFEFPAGADDSGSITIETCSDPAVLPFTGLYADEMAALGIILLMVGGLTLLTSRTRRARES